MFPGSQLEASCESALLSQGQAAVAFVLLVEGRGLDQLFMSRLALNVAVVVAEL